MKVFAAQIVLLVVCYIGTKAQEADPINCQEIKDSGETESRDYTIDPDGDGGVDPFVVYCDMSQDEKGISVIHHDQECFTHVPSGYEDPGSYVVPVRYTHSLEEMVALIDSSEKCSQMINLKCNGVQIWKGDQINSCWNNRNGEMRLNFGAKDGTEGCRCSDKGNCIDNGRCNCDSEQETSDGGSLSVLDDLPVSSMQFGDTGDPGEKSRYKLGSLKCSGYAAERE